MTSAFHRVKIVSPRGMSILTQVFIDDQELRGATFVSFATGKTLSDHAEVTLRLMADVEIDGEPVIVKEWRRAMGPRERLLSWLRR